MENFGGVVVLLSVLALFPALKLVAELVDLIGRKLIKKSTPEAQGIREHLQRPL
jgi:hypothetical protein